MIHHGRKWLRLTIRGQSSIELPARPLTRNANGLTSSTRNRFHRLYCMYIVFNQTTQAAIGKSSIIGNGLVNGNRSGRLNPATAQPHSFISGQKVLHKVSRDITRTKTGIIHYLQMQGDRSLNPFNHHRFQGPFHPGDGQLTCACVHNDFGNQGVIEGRDPVTRIHKGIDTYTGTSRQVESSDQPWRGSESLRILSVDATLDC